MNNPARNSREKGILRCDLYAAIQNDSDRLIKSLFFEVFSRNTGVSNFFFATTSKNTWYVVRKSKSFGRMLCIKDNSVA